MKILIVDDEETARYGLRKALDIKGKLYEAAGLNAARKIYREETPELVLLDLNLSGENGFDFLEELQSLPEPPKVIIITAHGSEKVAVEAIKKGAYDYLAKPFDIDELRMIVRNAAEQIELRKENESLKKELAASTGYGELMGVSEPMRRVYQLIETVAGTDVTVLLTGETGSGKELVARELHRRSPRAGAPFVTVNCAAVPENLLESELFGHEKGAFTGATQRRLGKFEKAAGGTLFLDEIGDMNLEMQAKILRAIEDKQVEPLGGNRPAQVDVRIISATHRDLKARVGEKQFREDLYYRLEVVQIHVPPLRQRGEDIPLLVDYFKQAFCKKHQKETITLTPQTLARLAAYSYPGNVRQLRNMVERLVVLDQDGIIEESELPEEIRFYHPAEERDFSGLSLEPFFSMEFKEARHSFETRYLLWRLRQHRNNISRTADAIGIHRQSLQQKIKELGLRAYLK